MITTINTTDISSALTSAYFVLPISFVAIILNSIALVILKRSKNIRSNRFNFLTVCLYITDIIASIFSCVLAISSMMIRQGTTITPHLCFSVNLITTTSVTISLVQIVFICLERLFATFPPTRNIKFTKHIFLLYILSVLFAIFYNACVYTFYGNIESNYCSLGAVFTEKQWIFDVYFATLQCILFSIIIVVYVIVIARLQKQFKQVNPILSLRTNSTNIENKRKSKSISELSHTEKLEYPEISLIRMNPNPTSSVDTLNLRLVPYQKTSSKGKYGRCRKQAWTDLNEASPTKPVLFENEIRPGVNTNNASYTPKKVGNFKKSLTSSQIAIKQTHGHTHTTLPTLTNIGTLSRVRQFKKALLTLGVIIIVTTVTILPSAITQIVYSCTNGIVPLRAVYLTNSILFVNPLIDPFIYVLRINEFRKTLKCTCR